VLLGDPATRRLYATLVLVPLGLSALAGVGSWPMLLGVLAAPLTVVQARRVLRGDTGRDLVRVLADTGVLLLIWSALTAVGLALGSVV
jgi:1,4-dihydroxy-2-naphthoate polyprenyltransferase